MHSMKPILDYVTMFAQGGAQRCVSRFHGDFAHIHTGTVCMYRPFGRNLTGKSAADFQNTLLARPSSGHHRTGCVL